MNKKFVTSVLTLLIVLSSGVTALASGSINQTTVTPSADYLTTKVIEPKAKIQALVDKGFVFGDSGGLRLEDEITRAEVTAMMVRIVGKESLASTMKTTRSIFSDVPTSNWANGCINVAVGSKLINGYPNKTFKPNNNITNAEVTAMLVRLVGGIDEPAKPGVPWSAPYIKKATETGVLKDVDIKNFSTPAKRGILFEMVYNVIQIRGEAKVVGNPTEAIVIDNERVGSTEKNTIRVRVLKDQYPNSKKGYAEDAEYTLNLTKLKDQNKTGANLDAEELLGKVILVYFDIDNNPIKYEVSNQYNYVAGRVTSIKADKVGIEGKSYDINIEKRGKEIKAEKELQSSIYNSKQDNFDSFNISIGLNLDEYVRATVKDGNLLFIEAFDFEDIAPVASEYNSKTKTIEFVSNKRSGDTDRLSVEDKDAYVLIKSKNGFKAALLDDIKKNDVIHFFKNTKKQTVIVALRANDSKVEGRLKGVKKAGSSSSALQVEIDNNSIPSIIGNNNFGAVYSKSTSGNKDGFHALTSSYENELKDLYGKKVVVYIDIYGNLQSLSGSFIKAQETKFIGFVTNKLSSEIQIMKEDGRTEYYKVTENTKFINGNSKKVTFNDFNKKDLVRVVAEDYEAIKLEKLTSNERNIIKITKNGVNFNGSSYNAGNNTKLFTFNKDEIQLDNLTNFANTVDTSKVLKGYVLVNEKDSTLADIIVITEYSRLQESKLEENLVSIAAIGHYGEGYEISVANTLGNKNFYYVESTELKNRIQNNEININDVVKFVINEAGKVVNFEVILSANSLVFKITETGVQSSSGLNYIVLEDINGFTKTINMVNKANIFGKYGVNSFVSIGKVDNYHSIELLRVVNTEITTGSWLTTDEIVVATLIKEIKALPEVIKLEDESKVEAVRLSYEALTAEQKALVKPEDYGILVNAETAVADLKAAKEFADALNLLPTLETLTIDDKSDVEAARDLYGDLTENQKELVSSAQLDVLIGLEVEIINLGA